MRARKPGGGADAALRFLEEGIAAGRFKPGDRLPTERELVVQFGTARNTIRKRLDTLAGEGKIVRGVGSGTFVARSPSPARPDVQSQSFLQRIHGASPAEVMEFRLMIEPQVMDLAIARASADNLARMETCLSRSEAAASIAEFEEWDGALHLEIVTSARNQLVIDLYEAINGVRRQAHWGKLKELSLTPERRARYQAQHRRIVEGMRQRDAAVARGALIEHLLAVQANLLGVSQPELI